MIIEMRTYTLQPGTIATFEERFAEALPVRAKLSPLAAFWHTEIGPLNRVIHVWPYENLEERTRIRAEATKLQGWPPNTREFVVEQQSEIYLPAPSRRRSSRASSAMSMKSAPTPSSRAASRRRSTGGARRSPSALGCRRWSAPGTRSSAGSTNGCISGLTRMRANVSGSAKRPAAKASGRRGAASPA